MTEKESLKLLVDTLREVGDRVSARRAADVIEQMVLRMSCNTADLSNATPSPADFGTSAIPRTCEWCHNPITEPFAIHNVGEPDNYLYHATCYSSSWEVVPIRQPAALSAPTTEWDCPKCGPISGLVQTWPDRITHMVAHIDAAFDGLSAVVAGVAQEEMAAWKAARFDGSSDYAQRIAVRVVEILKVPEPPSAQDNAAAGQQIHGITFLILRHDCVLLERCPKKARVLGVGEWFVPGGKLEDGESEKDALWREAWEELGINITESRPLPIIEGSPVPPGPKGTFLMRPYVVLNYGGELPERTVDESVELRFVPIEEALRSPVPQVRAMVAMATQRSHASSAGGESTVPLSAETPNNMKSKSPGCVGCLPHPTNLAVLAVNENCPVHGGRCPACDAVGWHQTGPPAQEGGEWVSSAMCGALEIASAQSCRTFKDGRLRWWQHGALGFVFRGSPAFESGGQ